eukprot:2219336-Prymnesium_polylepis.1
MVGADGCSDFGGGGGGGSSGRRAHAERARLEARARGWPVAVSFFRWRHRTRRGAASRAYAVRVSAARAVAALMGCWWEWRRRGRLGSSVR